MSLIATATGIILLLFRHIKKIPRVPLYTLWILVAIRLCVPFAISSEISIFGLARGLIKRVVKVPTPLIGPAPLNLSFTNSVGAAESYFPLTYKTQSLQQLFEILSTIWVVGVVSTITLVVILYFFTSKSMKKGKHFRDNIFVNPKVKTPFLLGIFWPKVMIPSCLVRDESALQYVLLHEHVHIKRKDNLLRILAIFIACIHWFNPFVWIFLKSFLHDLELTCDILAIKSLNSSQRKEYAKTLMDLSYQEHLSISSAFGESNPYTRVLNILTYKRLSVVALIYSVLLIIVLSITLLSNPMNSGR